MYPEDQKHFPQIKVIIMTGFQDVHFVELARRRGRTVSSTKKVLQTSSWTASTVPWRGASVPGVQERTTFGFYNATLTQREIQILHLVCQNLSYQEIADRLQLTRRPSASTSATCSAKPATKAWWDWLWKRQRRGMQGGNKRGCEEWTFYFFTAFFLPNLYCSTVWKSPASGILETGGGNNGNAE
jgi:hypothetical protein